MIFWTVVFITYYLATLLKGNLFHEAMQKVGRLEIKKATTDNETEQKQINKEIVSNSKTLFLAMPLVFIEWIYLFNALSIDTYKYPTIITIAYIVIGLVKPKKKSDKKDLTTEEGRLRFMINLEKMKKRSFKSFIVTLGHVAYFGYMFYILVLV